MTLGILQLKSSLFYCDYVHLLCGILISLHIKSMYGQFPIETVWHSCVILTRLWSISYIFIPSKTLKNKQETKKKSNSILAHIIYHTCAIYRVVNSTILIDKDLYF